MKKKYTIFLLAILLLVSCQKQETIAKPVGTTQEVKAKKETTLPKEVTEEQKKETFENVKVDPKEVTEENTDSETQKEEPVTEDDRAKINKSLTVLRNMKEGTAGASIGHFLAFVELLNNGEVLLKNPEETKYLIQELKNNLEDPQGYEAGIENIKKYSEDYFADPHSIDDMMQDSGAEIGENTISKEQMDQIIELLEK